MIYCSEQRIPLLRMLFWKRCDFLKNSVLLIGALLMAVVIVAAFCIVLPPAQDASDGQAGDGEQSAVAPAEEIFYQGTPVPNRADAVMLGVDTYAGPVTQAELDTLLSEETVSLLDAVFNFQIGRVTGAAKMMDEYGDTFTVFQVDDSAQQVTFNADGQIAGISNGFAAARDSMPASDYIDTVIEYFKSVLPEHFHLVSNKVLNEKHVQLIWQEQLQEGVYNSHCAVQLVVDTSVNAVFALHRFYQSPENGRKLSEEDALRSARAFLTESGHSKDLELGEPQLTVETANSFWETSADPGKVYLCYEISVGRDRFIWIDAETGEVISGDAYPTDHGAEAE